MTEPNILTPFANGAIRGPRLEIDEFLGSNEMPNLFLNALSKLQQDSLVPLEDGTPNWTISVT